MQNEFGKGKTILLVDDNDLIIKMLKNKLEVKGFSIISADNGKLSIKLAIEEQPDLIILDVEMPGINGYETCDIIKSLTITEDIPVVIFTSKDTGDDFDEAIEKHADGYMVKPVSDEHLYKVIEKLLQP